MRIALVTTAPDDLPVEDDDRPLHDSAFAALGVAVDHPSWHDTTVRWEAYDLVVVRSVWDYVERFDEFIDWVQRVGGSSALENPAPVLEWNLDKRYLLDLDAVGLPVIPTRIASDTGAVVAAADRFGGEVVLKPVVSAGSRSTGRFRVGDPSLVALAESILADGWAVMVQPAVPSVATEGEVGAVLFDGALSHAIRKAPILAAGGGQLDRGHESVSAAELTADQARLAGATMDAVGQLMAARVGLDRPLLYARVDMVTLEDGGVAVLEVELTEPAFFLATAPGAAERFARAVLARVGSAGRR